MKKEIKSIKSEILEVLVVVLIVTIVFAITIISNLNRIDSLETQIENQLLIPKEKVLIDTTQLVQYPDNSGSYATDVKRVRIIHVETKIK